MRVRLAGTAATASRAVHSSFAIGAPATEQIASGDYGSGRASKRSRVGAGQQPGMLDFVPAGSRQSPAGSCAAGGKADATESLSTPLRNRASSDSKSTSSSSSSSAASSSTYGSAAVSAGASISQPVSLAALMASQPAVELPPPVPGHPEYALCGYLEEKENYMARSGLEDGQCRLSAEGMIVPCLLDPGLPVSKPTSKSATSTSVPSQGGKRAISSGAPSSQLARGHSGAVQGAGAAGICGHNPSSGIDSNVVASAGGTLSSSAR